MSRINKWSNLHSVNVQIILIVINWSADVNTDWYSYCNSYGWMTRKCEFSHGLARNLNWPNLTRWYHNDEKVLLWKFLLLNKNYFYGTNKFSSSRFFRNALTYALRLTDNWALLYCLLFRVEEWVLRRVVQKTAVDLSKSILTWSFSFGVWFK